MNWKNRAKNWEEGTRVEQDRSRAVRDKWEMRNSIKKFMRGDRTRNPDISSSLEKVGAKLWI